MIENPSYARGLALKTRLEDVGLEHVALDPRSAHVPGVLITPPRHVFDLACGVSHRWTLVALATPPGNADSWRSLDATLAAVAEAVDIEEANPGQYVLTPEQEPYPCYLITFMEAG